MKLCIFSAFSVHKDVHSCDGFIDIMVIPMVVNEVRCRVHVGSSSRHDDVTQD